MEFMKYNLDEINEFFDTPESRMPDSVRDVIRNGEGFSRGDLETCIFEWNELSKYSEEIAEKIPAEVKRLNVPVLRKTNSDTTDYLVYHPVRGNYVGKFSVPIRTS